MPAKRQTLHVLCTKHGPGQTGKRSCIMGREVIIERRTMKSVFLHIKYNKTEINHNLAPFKRGRQQQRVLARLLCQGRQQQRVLAGLLCQGRQQQRSLHRSLVSHIRACKFLAFHNTRNVYTRASLLRACLSPVHFIACTTQSRSLNHA